MDFQQLPEFKDIGWRHIAYIASALVLAAIVIAFGYEIELKQDVPGEIVSQSEIKIQGFSGLVTDIYAKPRDRVRVGTPLFRLDRDLTLSTDGRPRGIYNENLRDEQKRSADEEFRQRSTELKVRLSTLEATLKNRQEERITLTGQIKENKRLVDEAGSKLSRLKSVSEYVVADRIEQAKAELGQNKIALAQSMGREQQLLAEISTIYGTQVELQAQLRALETTHERQLQDIQTRFERERQNMVISSPNDGLVTFSNLLLGQTIGLSDVAMVIGTDDNDALQVGLRIPSRRRGFIKEGQIVRLKFDAFPYTRFGTYESRITAISRTAVVPAQPEAPDAKSSGGGNRGGGGGEGDYIAWATLAGKTFRAGGEEYEILPGMKATGSVVVERRTIAEWVLAPIFEMFRG